MSSEALLTLSTLKMLGIESYQSSCTPDDQTLLEKVFKKKKIRICGTVRQEIIPKFWYLNW